ncbi:hypothetical protein [Streptomyces sp. NBC_00154]|nr:hypothetical protein [Streptomyces sp. NBC_00154]MCX5317867.1 hypothetical protein [Streptomyces sp. NBC_00154]
MSGKAHLLMRAASVVLHLHLPIPGVRPTDDTPDNVRSLQIR